MTLQWSNYLLLLNPKSLSYVINLHHLALMNILSPLKGLRWQSFSFSNCSLSVSTSSSHPLNVGVSQLSVLAPLFFSFYVLSFGTVIYSHISVPVYMLITSKLWFPLKTLLHFRSILARKKRRLLLEIVIATWESADGKNEIWKTVHKGASA